MKRILAATSIVLLSAVLFVACSSKGSSNDNSNTQPQLTGTVKVGGGSNQQQ